MSKNVVNLKVIDLSIISVLIYKPIYQVFFLLLFLASFEVDCFVGVLSSRHVVNVSMEKTLVVQENVALHGRTKLSQWWSNSHFGLHLHWHDSYRVIWLQH